ncbi:MAG: phosphoribosylaminoimidazolesuccinocarboxamide synthase, partial [Nitratireductor sp.]
MRKQLFGKQKPEAPLRVNTLVWRIRALPAGHKHVGDNKWQLWYEWVCARDRVKRCIHETAALRNFRAKFPCLGNGPGKAMNRRRRIYEGKAKILYEGPEPGTLIQFFKDDATAFNKKKHEIVDGKGVLNNRISEYIFEHLNRIGIPTHFIRRLNMREQLIKEVEIIPLEIVVRNVAAGSLAK